MYGSSIPYLGRSYGAASSALFARATPALDDFARDRIDELISGLIQCGAWAKMDALYVLAAPTAQLSLLNWKSTSFSATAVNSPTFTAYRGYTFNGTSNYINTGYNPVTAGGQYTLNNATMGAWIHDLTANSRSGHVNARLGANTANTLSLRGNEGTGSTPSVAGTTRMIAWSRSAAGQYTPYVNGAAATDIVITSTSLTNATIDIGRSDVAVFGAGGFRVWFVGASMTAAEHAGAFTAFNNYLRAVGAV